MERRSWRERETRLEELIICENTSHELLFYGVLLHFCLSVFWGKIMQIAEFHSVKIARRGMLSPFACSTTRRRLSLTATFFFRMIHSQTHNFSLTRESPATTTLATSLFSFSLTFDSIYNTNSSTVIFSINLPIALISCNWCCDSFDTFTHTNFSLFYAPLIHTVGSERCEEKTTTESLSEKKMKKMFYQRDKCCDAKVLHFFDCSRREIELHHARACLVIHERALFDDSLRSKHRFGSVLQWPKWIATILESTLGWYTCCVLCDGLRVRTTNKR